MSKSNILLDKNTFTQEQKREIANYIKPITLDEVNKEFAELVKIGKEITYQSEIITDKLPINE